MSALRLLVIGGGFAGVAAAAALRSRGAAVTLLEQRPVLGGRARSDELADLTVDTGAQLIVTSFTRTVRLLTSHAALGETSPGETSPQASAFAAHDDRLQRTKGRDTYVRDGVGYAIQYGSVRSLLTFGGLGALEKLKLGRHLLPLIALHRAQLDADATRLPASLDGESAGDFVTAHVGQRAADVLVEPPLNGFYGVRGSEASLGFFLILGRYGTESEVLAARDGWTRALAAALRGATFEGGSRVIALERAAGGGLVARGDDGREWPADGAVVATGPRSAQALLTPLLSPGAPLLTWLGAVPLRPTWTLALALDVALERSAFGVFQDPRRARVVSACAVHGAKLATPPRDRDVVLAWPTPDAAARMRESPSEEIVAAMLTEVEELIPAVRGHVTRARVYRFEEGTPIAHPGFAADRARARALTEALPLPIALAGDYLTTPIIEGAVASGERAAQHLAERLAQH